MNETSQPASQRPLHILLADDDKDNHFLFSRALRYFPIPLDIVTVEDGEKLMDYLSKDREVTPDVLFLDLNMPRKNGFQCLAEIKLLKNPKHLPVIVFSVSMPGEMAASLYDGGAYYYLRKSDIDENQKEFFYILTLLAENKLVKPPFEKFILNTKDAKLKSHSIY